MTWKSHRHDKKRLSKKHRKPLTVDEQRELDRARIALEMNEHLAPTFGLPSRAEARETVRRLTGRVLKE